jgi:hypothetical protein
MRTLNKVLAVAACILSTRHAVEAQSSKLCSSAYLENFLEDHTALLAQAMLKEIACDEFKGSLPADLWKLSALTAM